MKKLMFLCVALLAVPAMAVVEFSGVDNGGGTLTISYECVDVDSPRGIALLLTCDGTLELTGYEAASADDKMNCFIDYAYSNDPYNLGEGHPIADPAGPGALDATAGVTELSLCMGALDETENQLPGDPDGVVATLTYTGSGNLTIAADTLRGPGSGVVGSELPSNLSDGGIVVIENVGDGIVECIKADSPLYQPWSDWGKPDCWCYARNCKGDADGKKIGDYWVQGEDLNALIASYFKVDVDLPAGGICADFDHKKIGDYRVQGEDLNLLIEYYFDLEGDIPECPKDWDGVNGDDYNDWKTPL